MQCRSWCLNQIPDIFSVHPCALTVALSFSIGVLAASALDAYGCGFQGRFIFDNENLRSRALNMGITDLDKKYEISEIIKGDSIFCATGITDGDLVKGISKEDDFFKTHTLITHKSQNYK